jgi:hypothetical protein
MNRFHASHAWIGTLFAVCALLAPAVAAADERILDFHSDITVDADASMRVTETIRVRAEGDRIRHGIFRDFPTVYRDRSGMRVRHPQFGVGNVISVEEQNDDFKVTVRFNSVGVKKLLAKYAKLEPA